MSLVTADTPSSSSSYTHADEHADVDADFFRRFGFGAQSTLPFATVHQAFIHHATRIPSDTALRDLSGASPTEVTYGDLLLQSQFVATQLRQAGVTPGGRVLLLVKRSAEMVAGILGILMAGAQYIPMDGNVSPDGTLQRAVEQCGVTVVLCLRQFEPRVRDFEAVSSVLVLEELLQSESYGQFNLNFSNLICDGDAESGCYVIYTSGTTGDPKGVDVTHRNVTNLLCQAPGNLGMTRGSKVGQVLSVGFDMGAWEILGSMANGATLVLRGSDWAAALKQIDTLICTPSILARFNPEEFPNIRTLATAGEPSTQNLADKWAVSGATYYNCCGPTETTIVNTMHRHIAGESLTIGKPTPNNNVYILDEKRSPCRNGEVGTIWAGGAGVTRGYLGQPERTAERYFDDPFANDGSMMYNTGDLARWLPDGSLETLGRDDDQVKIKGFRVELDGVSACIAACPGVTRAATLIIGGELTGFLTPKAQNIEALQENLKAKLPYYAIPCNWLPLDEFPLTPNGKIDKRALIDEIRNPSTPQPDADAARAGEKELRTSTISTPSSYLSYPAKELPLPEKHLSRPWRGLRHRIFIVYRRLFSLIFLANLATLLCFLLIPTINRRHISTVAFVNLTIAVLVRQDVMINILYTICCSVPKSWPLAIRRRCAKIYHLGGVHSGAAVMAVAWYTGDICHNIASFATQPKGLRPSPLTLTLSLIALSIFISMIALAYPTIRKKHHNLFERVHRFAGWTALAIVWVQTFSSIQDQRRPLESLGHAVITTPSFWMLIVITLSIASSWFFLRTVPVDAEVLSNHAVRLHFDYTVPVNGTFTRLSKRPLIEWHSFATVPAPEVRNGRPKGYSLVVSRAGDWTGGRISKPPTKLWIRGVPTCGVMRIATLFNRVVLVGTGSGIGPLLGHIQVPTCPFRLVWSTPNPAATFGQDIVHDVYRADPGAVIHDTKKQGRPDLVQLTWNAVQGFDAEAVIVISNEKLTKKVVYGMETRGVPAYGAIWDS
ncbi:putative NRPS-like enzyme [Aspergillus lucknowensis]|uniref:AMP-dependent synthetase/ligase domain-containing protein n=1 Tax=Aspergillus lucknowensis TaxID=176173 RepID=A0ABR4M719_9EURO